MNSIFSKFSYPFWIIGIPSTIMLTKAYNDYTRDKLNRILLKKFGHPLEFIEDAPDQEEVNKFIKKIDSQWFGVIRCSNETSEECDE